MPNNQSSPGGGSGQGFVPPLRQFQQNFAKAADRGPNFVDLALSDNRIPFALDQVSQFTVLTGDPKQSVGVIGFSWNQCGLLKTVCYKNFAGDNDYKYTVTVPKDMPFLRVRENIGASEKVHMLGTAWHLMKPDLRSQIIWSLNDLACACGDDSSGFVGQGQPAYPPVTPNAPYVKDRGVKLYKGIGFPDDPTQSPSENIMGFDWAQDSLRFVIDCTTWPYSFYTVDRRNSEKAFTMTRPSALQAISDVKGKISGDDLKMCESHNLWQAMEFSARYLDLLPAPYQMHP